MTEYITRAGDRWDLMAFKAYGTVNDIVMGDGTKVNAMSAIANANPGIALEDVLAEGLVLQIPIVPIAGVNTDKSLLPPWKSN